MAHLHLSGDADADKLLGDDPLALLIGFVLDQQVPLERAFSSPRDLKDRLGGRLDASEIARMDPERLAAVFSERPALHRFPAANAKRVQDMCCLLVDEYGGSASKVWSTAASGEELLGRVRALPGFGEQKARIFVAFLAKQLGVRPAGWEKAAGKFGEKGSFLSVADITDKVTLGKVRAYKQQMKAAAKAAAEPAS